ncbi:hypothetical protein TNCV_1732111 [Trichonephila clavipes]|nr:hypothetical protein TNCV_1732111 [Trichonephila clavipes]
MRHCRTPNAAVIPLSSAMWSSEPSLLEAVPSLDHCSQQSFTKGYIPAKSSKISLRKKIHPLIKLYYSISFKLGELLIMASSSS